MNAARSMKIAMAQRDLNQEQLASLAGITQSSISGLAGRNKWNGESLVKISKALGLKVSEFVALGED